MFIRNFISLVLLTVVFALFHRQVFRIRLKHLPIFLAAGLISVLCLAITYFNCQMHCSLAVAGILLYLAPSFVVLMSALLWKAPLTKRKLLALGGDTSVSAVGLLLGVGAAFCYATYTIFAHYGLAHYDSYTMIYWTFLVAGIGSLFFLNPTELAAAMPDSRLWLGTAGLVVIATVLPYIFYTKGLEGVESGKASIIANVEPVVAALTGVVFFHETLSIWTLLGVACVLGGVILLAKGDDTCKESHSSTAST